MKRIITKKQMREFEEYLRGEEKSKSTISKYLCDIHKLEQYLQGAELTKERMIAYKNFLVSSGKYQISSVNSYLTAANQFCSFMGWSEVIVKTCKVQRELFSAEKRYLKQAEYKRLVETAYKEKKERIGLIIQTIAGTGMRVSELKYLTVESLGNGMIVIHSKGKVRKIFMPKSLQNILKKYCKKQKIKHGIIFCTRTGKTINRSNIWREMKNLSRKANVDESKIFPHNLRHLFARRFYEMKQDLAKLADVLGHSSVETTRLYIMTTGEKHRRQLDKMKMVIMEQP